MNRQHPAIDIDGARLMDDLRALARIGAFETGVDRTAFSDADVEARAFIARRLQEAGLTVEQDCYGNVMGRWPDAARAVLVGSHTDTVPKGGWLDGALGVVYALEIARALREGGGADGVGVDVIDFQDEEGTFIPCLGSRAFVGALEDREVIAATAPDGRSLTEAMEAAGLSGAPLRLDPARHVAFMEAHIEQGPRLEATGTPVGVATGFVGIRRMALTATGRADHAGTTPMAMRRDAGLPLFHFAAWVSEAFAAAGGPDTVFTIGKVELEPGAVNVVPAAGRLILEFRDTDPAVLDRLEAMAREKVAALSADSSADLSADTLTRIPPMPTDPMVSTALSAAAGDLQKDHLDLPSGAGHDCMILSPQLPSGLMFVPSIGGRSHSVDEDTAAADIVEGCRVMARAVARVIAEA
jgi:N-carbamoyl-L-amino-acid hydrolase